MDDDETIEYPARPRRRWRLPLVLAVLAVFFGAGTTASYYVDALWFGSLGYAVVFWKALNIQAIVFGAFAAATLLRQIAWLCTSLGWFCCKFLSVF